MYNDPSGEFLPLIFGLSAFWTAVVVGSAIGVAAYCITSAVMGQQLTPLGVLKSAFFGAISGAANFGIGSIFTSCTGSLTVAESLAQNVGGLGSAIIQAGTHAISQGVLGLMQGGNFLNSAAGGFFGSMGATAFGAIAGNFANSAVGTIAFGALAGGVGSELAGGNFWHGAVIGGTVAGLNHSMHAEDNIDFASQAELEYTIDTKMGSFDRMESELSTKILLTSDSNLPEGYVLSGIIKLWK